MQSRTTRTWFQCRTIRTGPPVSPILRLCVPLPSPLPPPLFLYLLPCLCRSVSADVSPLFLPLCFPVGLTSSDSPPFLCFLLSLSFCLSPLSSILSLSLCPLPCVFPLCSRSHPHCLSILSLSRLYLLFLSPSLSPYFIFCTFLYISSIECLSSLCSSLSAPHLSFLLSFPPLFLPSDCPTFISHPHIILVFSFSLSFQVSPPCLFPASVSLCVCPYVSVLFLFTSVCSLLSLSLCLSFYFLSFYVSPSASSLLSLPLCLSPSVFVL